MSTKPLIVVVDDEDQTPLVMELEKLETRAVYRHPRDITLSDLSEATLLVLDEYLEDWAERDVLAAVPAQDVRDGLALSSILRARLDRRGQRHTPGEPARTAITLRTGDLDKLAAGTPRALRATSVAAGHDLEWVFEKQHSTASQFAVLAAAVAALPNTWDPQDPTPQSEWLALNTSQSWADRALVQIERCRPPWSRLASANAGRPWLAWFLQRILPFSTFLIDDAHAAALLGVTAKSFTTACDSNDALNEFEYRGHLRGFAGRRWWRAGIQRLRAQLSAECNAATNGELAVAVGTLLGSPLDELEVDDPVFAIDEDYFVDSIPISARAAVRLQPDDWPAYADEPWLSIEDADDDTPLARLVVTDDREYVGVEG